MTSKSLPILSVERLQLLVVEAHVPRSTLVCSGAERNDAREEDECSAEQCALSGGEVVPDVDQPVHLCLPSAFPVDARSTLSGCRNRQLVR